MGGDIKYIHMEKHSMKENDMDVKPMKYIQDIKATYTSDIALETRQF